MKIIHSHDHYYTLSFARGEDVPDGLLSFAREQKIAAAHITGLGAAGALDLAFYNLKTKSYERTAITEDVEILSLTGNIGIDESEKVAVHLHGVFGKRDLSAFGGHLFSLIISGAGEIHVRAFPGAIHRAYDDMTGLTLMCEAAS